MCTSLFSVFDPSTSLLSLSTGWMILFCWVIIIPRKFWKSKTYLMGLGSTALMSFMHEWRLLFGPTNMCGALLCVTLFEGGLIWNLSGLFPFIFTPTSHPVITLSLALSLWLGAVTYSVVWRPLQFLSHLVPQGTPPMLMGFMVLIETISNLIRPLTLAVRLSANMIAGHLLMALLGGAFTVCSSALGLGVVGALIPLFILEMAVGAIQAYVFTTLVTLYMTET